MVKKYIILLICSTFSILKLSGGEWAIYGAINVFPYRPYYYNAGMPTDMLTKSESLGIFTWKVTNGKIMDSSGNYTLSTFETGYGGFDEISIMWDSANNGSLSVYENGSFLKSLPVTIGSGNLTVSGIYSGNNSFDKAYITVENATFQSRCVSDINGYKSVTLKSGFTAVSGSKVRIFNQILEPIWSYYRLMTRSTIDNQLLSTEKSEVKIGQNIPNPFKDYTKVEYFISEDCHSAYIQVCDSMGKLIKKISLTDKGNNWIFLDRANLSRGVYLYSLIVDNQLVETKRMLVED